MYRVLLIIAALFLTSCAFYEKKFVSEIALEGTNYRGTIYDEGQFYINDEPSIRLDIGCYRSTQLGETVFPLVPLPVFDEQEPHASIASQQFSLVISHGKKDDIDLSALRIAVELAGSVHPLRFAKRDEPPYTYSTAYEYVADLRCGDIVDGVLKIYLGPDKIRVYGMQFEEGVKREVDYHLSLVT